MVGSRKCACPMMSLSTPRPFLKSEWDISTATHRKQDVLHHLLPHQQVDDAHDVRNRQQPGGVVHHVQQEPAHNIAIRPAERGSAGVWECGQAVHGHGSRGAVPACSQGIATVQSGRCVRMAVQQGGRRGSAAHGAPVADHRHNDVHSGNEGGGGQYCLLHGWDGRVGGGIGAQRGLQERRVGIGCVQRLAHTIRLYCKAVLQGWEQSAKLVGCTAAGGQITAL